VKIDFDRLLFRRQYIIGPKAFHPNENWDYLNINNDLILSVHRDLPYAIDKNDQKLTIFIGLGFDPFHPDYDEQAILSTLNKQDISSLIKSTYPIAGRWSIVFQENAKTYLFTDPCGYRQVFYYSDGCQSWCASQPELIKANCLLTYNTDENLHEFIASPEFSQQESAWIGSETIYQNCFHLLPNHYLIFNNNQQVRFYPNTPLLINETPKIIEETSETLKGILAAIANRSQIALALTSGWDSRLLLAASKDLFPKVKGFIDRKGTMPKDHPDLIIATKLAKKLNLDFEIKNSSISPPGWFISLLSTNVTSARVLSKTNMIYSRYIDQEDVIFVNGNCGEIFRNYYDRYCQEDINKISVEKIVSLLGYKGKQTYIRREIEKWKNDFEINKQMGWNLLDFLYWEQRLGNWGAQFPAEEDIAADEISPLNCRLLIDTLLSSPREERSAPEYKIIRKLIHSLLPEALDFPFNPKKRQRLFKIECY